MIAVWPANDHAIGGVSLSLLKIQLYDYCLLRLSLGEPWYRMWTSRLCRRNTCIFLVRTWGSILESSFIEMTHKETITIYIYAVMLLTGPRLAIFIVTNWATLIVTNWVTSFSHYKNRDFRCFFWCSVISLCFFLFSVIFQLSKNSLFQKRVQKLVFLKFQCFKLFFLKILFF